MSSPGTSQLSQMPDESCAPITVLVPKREQHMKSEPGPSTPMLTETSEMTMVTVGHKTDKGDYICPHCNRTFREKYRLASHLLKRQQKNKCRLPVGSLHNICDYCSYAFTRSQSLKDHLRARAKAGSCALITKGPVTKTVLTCPTCRDVSISWSAFITHTWEVHNHEATIVEETLTSNDAVAERLARLADTHHISWTVCKGRGSRQSTRTYTCNRSGSYTESRGKGIRGNRDSVKMNGHCTAFVTTQRKSPTDIRMQYCAQHFGHDVDPNPAPVALKIKARMKQLRRSGIVDSNEILTKCQSEFPTAPDVATEMVKRVVHSHEEDMVQVNARIRAEMSSGNEEVFVTSEEMLTGVFTMFGIQTMRQRALWKLAHKFLIIDTRIVTRHRHVVWSLVSIDSTNKMHVLANLFVEANSKKDVWPLLRVLRMRCGETHPVIFMSNTNPAVFNSWRNGFGWNSDSQSRTTCEWHAVSNITRYCYGQGIEYLPFRVNDDHGDGDALRKQVMGHISRMASTEDKQTFMTEKTALIRLIGPTPDGGPGRAPQFLTYLEDNYFNRPEEWSRAYRRFVGCHVTLGTLDIDSLFRRAKYIYVKGTGLCCLDVNKMISLLFKTANDEHGDETTNEIAEEIAPSTSTSNDVGQSVDNLLGAVHNLGGYLDVLNGMKEKLTEEDGVTLNEIDDLLANAKDKLDVIGARHGICDWDVIDVVYDT